MDINETVRTLVRSSVANFVAEKVKDILTTLDKKHTIENLVNNHLKELLEDIVKDALASEGLINIKIEATKVPDKTVTEAPYANMIPGDLKPATIESTVTGIKVPGGTWVKDEFKPTTPESYIEEKKKEAEEFNKQKIEELEKVTPESPAIGNKEKDHMSCASCGHITEGVCDIHNSKLVYPDENHGCMYWQSEAAIGDIRCCNCSAFEYSTPTNTWGRCNGANKKIHKNWFACISYYKKPLEEELQEEKPPELDPVAAAEKAMKAQNSMGSKRIHIRISELNEAAKPLRIVYTDKKYREDLDTQFGVKSSKDLTPAQVEVFIKYIHTMEHDTLALIKKKSATTEKVVESTLIKEAENAFGDSMVDQVRKVTGQPQSEQQPDLMKDARIRMLKEMHAAGKPLYESELKEIGINPDSLINRELIKDPTLPF